VAGRGARLGGRLLAAAARRAALAAEGWYDLAYVLAATAPAVARAAYRRALELDGAHAHAHLNLGRLLHAEGDPAAALPHYRRAAALRGDEPTPQYNLGVALQDTGELDGAVDAYAKALALDPGFADAHFNLSGLYEQLGDRARALAELLAYRSLTRG
jgi:Flp pilus assembly protein TadD